MVESITGEFSKSGDFTISSSRDLLVNGKRSGTVQEQEVIEGTVLSNCVTRGTGPSFVVNGAEVVSFSN
jgi:hypothetical protein